MLIAFGLQLLLSGAAHPTHVDPLAILSDCNKDPLCRSERIWAISEPVWGTRGDGWPERLRVTGTIAAVLPTSCGIALGEASLLVKLHETVPEIAAEYITVYVGCIYGAGLLGQVVTFSAKKLRKRKQIHVVNKTFDSGNSPVYVTRYFERCYREDRQRGCP